VVEPIGVVHADNAGRRSRAKGTSLKITTSLMPGAHRRGAAARLRETLWVQAEHSYDLLIFLEKKRVLDFFLFLLSCADPPVISPVLKNFLRPTVERWTLMSAPKAI